MAFSHEIELAFTSIKNRQSNKPLTPEEVQKHLNAISASVSNKGALRRPKKNSSKVQPSAGPEGQESVAPEGQVPEGTTNHGTRKAVKVRNKRKRSEVKVKSKPESESSESRKIPKNDQRGQGSPKQRNRPIGMRTKSRQKIQGQQSRMNRQHLDTEGVR